MTLIGLIALVILIVLAAWLIQQFGLAEPFRTILLVILLLLVLVGVFYVLGFPTGELRVR